MKSVVENLKHLLTSRAPVTPESRVNIITSRRAMGKALFESKHKGNVVGVCSPSLGEGMLLLGVEDFCAQFTEPVFIFNNYDVRGTLLRKKQVALSEIRSVCPFDSAYTSPVEQKHSFKQPVLIY
jgi:hypothetical protein